MTSPIAPTAYADRSLALLLTLCALFTAFFVVGDIIGAKLFTFSLFGLTPQDLGLSEKAGPFIGTVGILYFPMTFVLTDILNEYFGSRVVRTLTFIAIGVVLLLQPLILWSIAVPTVSFNPAVSGEQMHQSFATVLGPSWAIIVGSCTAFAIGQLLDVSVFAWLRRITGARMLWLRAQVSTLISQLIDSFVVIFLAFVLVPMLTGGSPWPAASASEVSITNYAVKVVIAIGITPLLYGVHWAVEAWLGRDEAHRLAAAAHPG